MSLRNIHFDDSRNQPRPIPQHVHCCHSMDGDICIDSHLDCNAASQELSALYNDNGAHVGTDLDARPQGHGSWMLNASFISSLIRKNRSPIII